MHTVLSAALAIVAGWFVLGYAAAKIRDLPRTPDHVRSAAGAASRLAAHPVQAARSRSIPAPTEAESEWQKARAADWLDRQRARRERNAALGGGVVRRAWTRMLVKGDIPGVPGSRPRSILPEPPGPAPAPKAAVPAPRTAPSASPAPSDRTTGRNAPVTVTDTRPAKLAPPAWAAAISMVDNFDASDSAELLGFFTAQARGFIAYAEALAQKVEDLREVTGLDALALRAVADAAEIVTEAGTRLAAAPAEFRERYAGALETVESGVQMPHKGRFITAGS